MNFDLNITELRSILSSELKGIRKFDLADKVDLLTESEVKDILLSVFIFNYKKENNL